MNIKILDSWLREYLKTEVGPVELAEKLSLSSVSVESLEKVKNDYVYDIEITTNRVDLMSVKGLAREAAIVLKSFGKKANFQEKKHNTSRKIVSKSPLITIKNDPSLVNRITAVVLEVDIGESSEKIKTRLESSGIRSLNNLIDVTNYIMREMGHPAHVFDYDLIRNKKITIRKSKKGENITTLDNKTHTLSGGDIVALDGKDNIIDLLGIMGLKNSVVNKGTKRILLFLDNNNPILIRKTSMSLGLRSEAAVINEKNVDPELMLDTLKRGIELYEEIANGKVISDIIDIYPNKWSPKTISLEKAKIERVIGIDIDSSQIKSILEGLGFLTKIKDKKFNVTVPSWRDHDIFLGEDIIEEVARIYGYHKIPAVLPSVRYTASFHLDTNEFYWENRIKNALKYWGFNECYTYSMVSEKLYEGPISSAVTIKNPLTNDHVYMRRTIVPSLLEVARINQTYEEFQFFEISNVYLRRSGKLPNEVLHLAGVVKGDRSTFYNVKGTIEGFLFDIGIKHPTFKKRSKGGLGSDIYIGQDFLGEIEILEDNLSNFELDFSVMLKHAKHKLVYTPIAKHPPVIEDIRIITDGDISHQEIVSTIKGKVELIHSVELIDIYENKRTFRITYLDRTKNLTNKEVAPIRESIYKILEKKFNARIG